MTNVLDRVEPEPVLVMNDLVEGLAPDPRRSAHVAVAALSTGAAVIHVAMAPAHAGDSLVLGLGFVVAAWSQLAVAVLAITRPNRRLWLAALVLNAGLLGTWAVSRTAGLPLGEHAGHAESMTIVDLTCVAMEVAIVVLAIGLVATARTRWWLRGRVLAIGIPALTVIGASVALASPDARSTAHDDHDMVDGDDGHEHETDEDTKGLGQFANGHAHEPVNVTLDPATQAALDAQLAVTRDLAATYPTAQHAVDAGYRRVGPYIPGLGIHFIKTTGAELNFDGVMDDEDLRHPLALLYTSHAPTAELAGYMYYSASSVEPVGFQGRNDGWHYHEQLCAVNGPEGLDFPFGPDLGATKEQCDAAGGFLIEQTQWMVHVWTVPGYEIPDGVFAEENPALACSDGTYYMVDFDEWVDHPLNVCQSGASGPPS
jgi:hypothetical protein